LNNPRPERLTFGNLLKNFFRDLISADQGLWGTIVQLTIRPKRVVETFLLKDRKQFIRPTRYVLFALSVSALSFLAVQYTKGKPMLEYLQPAIEKQVSGINNERNRKDLAEAIAPEVPGLHDSKKNKRTEKDSRKVLAMA